jgi:plastocyanin
MLRWLTVVCSCLALGLPAAGCGGGDNEGEAGGGKKEPAQNPGGGKTAKVSMKNIQFHPAKLSVSGGTTVTWTNDESVNHDVTKTSGPGPKFSSGTGNLGQGDTYKQTLNRRGTIEYVCTVHPNMTGTITVK